jgi:molybdenum cofactor cytidylyltransferase
MLSAIVLAAGLSKRMGEQNKLLLPYKNKTIIEITLDNIIASGINDINVITGYEHEQVEASIKHLPVKIIFNPAYEKGMTTSIQQGVSHAGENGYMICLADMFLVTSAEYTFLKAEFERALQQNKKCICVPKYKEEKGNPVIFSSFYKEAILQHTEMEGCKTIVQSNKENIYYIEIPGDHILQDLDYYTDYEKFLSGE